MNAHKGYIIITDFEWYSFLKENYSGGWVNFWRKDIRKINNLNKGDRIYFFNKKNKKMKNRRIIGMAEFNFYDVKSVNDAWKLYHENNGYASMEYMIQSLNSDNSEKISKDSKIGCMILKEIIFFNKFIDLKDVNIKFEKNIQRGKTIKIKDEEKILNFLDRLNYIEEKLDDELAIDSIYNVDDEGRECERKVKVRINQYKFRDGLIKRYGKCLICGMDNQELLIASHSKPWRISSPKERIDLDNGLLLCANHDSLYDKCLISFDLNGNIIISECITEKNRKLLNISKETTINVSDKCMKYIEWQREEFLKREKNLLVQKV